MHLAETRLVGTADASALAALHDGDDLRPRMAVASFLPLRNEGIAAREAVHPRCRDAILVAPGADGLHTRILAQMEETR